MLKNDFFEFPKVKWLRMTREMDRSVRYSCHSKNRKVDVLGTGYIFICIGIKLKDVILIFKTKFKNKFAANVPETKTIIV